MAENETVEGAAAGAGQKAQAQPNVRLLAHFVRDLSFENVGAVQGTPVKGQPEIQVAVNIEAAGIGENRYQILTKVNATAKTQEAVRFVIELEYAGIFSVENVPQEHLHPFLFIECPRQLFPFPRRVIADATRDGGFPPLMLENVDFAALYRQKVEQIRAEKAAEKDKAEQDNAGQAAGDGAERPH